MATSKRERQKTARREKLAQQQRAAQRRRNLRRGVIAAVAAAVVITTGALLFAGGSGPSATTTTTAISGATATTTTSAPVSSTTTKPVKFAPVAQPSPAGTFGTPPTVVVPSGTPPTSLQVSDLIPGSGPGAKNGDKLKVQYVLATYSSHKVVQSSWTAQPFTLTLGAGTVIPGWEYGLVGMKAGARRELIIPPALGYGSVAQGPGIAANDTLVFVVDLLKLN
ncbi:MAG TPA: FKBP-type peptidyl-prolyl cis-trans isomerase [Acidimicrobiales bacterium]|nr:FKBP-type peptidyl-prolyl cis-trans isomerase [Acidimicrobiales bacterium]